MGDERPNAMLTKTQRAFLRGEKEYTGNSAKQQRYERRRAIQERVQNTLLDFQLLFDTWEDRGTGSLFGENPSQEETGKALSTLLALLYTEAHTHNGFRNLLTRGVRQGENRLNPDDESDVTINFEVERITRVQIEDALDRYSDREGYKDMSDEELAAIAQMLRQEKKAEAADMAREAWERKMSHFPDVFDEGDESEEREDDPLDSDGPYDPTDEFE